MSWKKQPYWIKGGILLSIIVVILDIILPSGPSFFEELVDLQEVGGVITYLFFGELILIAFGDLLSGILYFFIGLALFFGIGAFFGLIYKKFKRKR